jgi:hypothetical protein
MKRLIIRVAMAAFAMAAVTTVTAASPTHGVTLGVTGRTNATPSIAASGDVVAVVWGATSRGSSGSSGATDVYVALSRNGGRLFGPPLRVNDVDGDASLGGEQPPQVALVPRAGHEPSIVVVWTAKQAGGTRILSARSDDGGASFGRAAPITGGEAAGNRGWESITIDRDGQVVAVWLDHRELATGTSGAMHHEGHDHGANGGAKSDGVARAQLSKLYFSRVGTSGSPDGTGQGQVIAAGVCYCCKTTVAAAPDGSLYAAWRHVYPGNIRDIAFTASRDGGRTFAAPLRVSDDDWALDGCPENGPAMAVDSRNRVHVVWPTLVNGATPDAEPALELFYAVSTDGRSFAPRLKVQSEGVPRHVRIVAAADDSLVLVWEEQTSHGRRVVMGRARAGDGRFTREVVSGAGSAVYPVIALVGRASILAWTSVAGERSSIEVRRIEP